MRTRSIAKLAALPLFAAGAAFAQQNAAPVPPQDNMAACLPEKATQGPGLQVEVTDEFGPWRAGETVMISDANGVPLATLSCEGPWANFRLEPGTYKVFAFLGSQQSDELAVNVTPAGSQVTLKLVPPPADMPAPPILDENGRIQLPPPPPDLFQPPVGF
jgi:hypothetical protein